MSTCHWCTSNEGHMSKVKVNFITLYSIDTHFDARTTDSFWKHCEKRGNNEQFLFFPQCFLLNLITVSPFVHIFDIIHLFAIELEEPKIGISDKGLTLTFNPIHTMTPFDAPGKQAFLKTLWKKEKLLVQAISPFPKMFSTLSKTEIINFAVFKVPIVAS